MRPTLWLALNLVWFPLAVLEFALTLLGEGLLWAAFRIEDAMLAWRKIIRERAA